MQPEIAYDPYEHGILMRFPIVKEAGKPTGLQFTFFMKADIAIEMCDLIKSKIARRG